MNRLGTASTVDLRAASHGDLAELAALEVSSFGGPWSKSALAGELDKESTRCWLALDDEHAVGYACFTLLMDEAELLRLAVLPERRRGGVGRHLLEGGLKSLASEGCSVCHLEVRADNVGARGLYESLGFTVGGRRTNYYRGAAGDADGHPVDAILYRRSLPPAEHHVDER